MMLAFIPLVKMGQILQEDTVCTVCSHTYHSVSQLVHHFCSDRNVSSAAEMDCNDIWCRNFWSPGFLSLQIWDILWLFRQYQREVDICGLYWNIWINIGWIAVKFYKQCNVPQRLKHQKLLKNFAKNYVGLVFRQMHQHQGSHRDDVF